MNNSYLIPANSKKSMLILGFFTPVDLVIFLVGCTITMIALIMFKNATMWQMILIISPALFGAFLVAPVPNYHNVLQLITNIVTFYLGRRRYYWKGWCIKEYGKDDNTSPSYKQVR